MNIPKGKSFLAVTIDNVTTPLYYGPSWVKVDSMVIDWLMANNLDYERSKNHFGHTIFEGWYEIPHGRLYWYREEA